LTVLQDDRINEVTTLHAAPRSEIPVAALIQKIEALLGHHEASAP
jgi:hypothetical protein